MKFLLAQLEAEEISAQELGEKIADDPDLISSVLPGMFSETGEVKTGLTMSDG